MTGAIEKAIAELKEAHRVVNLNAQVKAVQHQDYDLSDACLSISYAMGVLEGLLMIAESEGGHAD